MGLGSEIRDPGSGKNLFRKKPIPDPYPGVKKAPDPGSGSATLVATDDSVVLVPEYVGTLGTGTGIELHCADLDTRICHMVL
jgi:hypothetical protein